MSAITKNITTTSEISLSVGFLINKLNRDTLDSLVRSLRKYFNKKVKASSFELSEVNTFLFFYSTFSNEMVANANQRIEIEKGLMDILLDYGSKESKNYAAKISKNIEIKDISQILLDLNRTSTSKKTKEVETEVKRRIGEIQNRSLAHVSDVILSSFVITWDFPNEHSDYIILPNQVLERHVTPNKSKIPLAPMIENLTLNQFAATCITNLSWIVGSFEHAIDNFSEMLSIEKKTDFIKKNINKQLWRTLRVMFGLLSTTQQVISDLLKQINRVSDIRLDLSLQIKALDFPIFSEYISNLNLDAECTDYTIWLNQLQQTIKLTYSTLLDLINCCGDVGDRKIDDVSDIVSTFAWTLADIQVMKFFSDKFRDLAFFQSIPIEVQVENEKEIQTDIDSILKGIALFKTYRLFGSTVYALRGADLDVNKGEMVAILGPSGSGKTTLLNLLAGLDTPERGGVFILGKNINKLSDSEMSIFRRNNMGFIFQYYNLIPQLTVLENVMLPGIMIGRSHRETRRNAMNLLKEVGIDQFKDQFPVKLSGGQMQRVTIAESMINDPAILFADEPTGDLDSLTGEVVVELIHRFAREKGTAVLFVTHDPAMAERCDRIVRIQDGRVVDS